MNPNELRIGNYLYSPVGDALLIVEELSKDNIISKVVDRSKYPLPDGWSTESIPLTQYWVDKLGISNRKLGVFEIFGDNKRGFHIALNNEEWLMLETVHQLQNIHFLFMGEELTLKSNK
jgi:hypothetical protein